MQETFTLTDDKTATQHTSNSTNKMLRLMMMFLILQSLVVLWLCFDRKHLQSDIVALKHNMSELRKDLYAVMIKTVSRDFFFLSCCIKFFFIFLSINVLSYTPD